VSLVVDGSMTIAWLFAGERSAVRRDILRRVATEGALMPSLLATGSREHASERRSPEALR